MRQIFRLKGEITSINPLYCDKFTTPCRKFVTIARKRVISVMRVFVLSDREEVQQKDKSNSELLALRNILFLATFSIAYLELDHVLDVTACWASLFA